MKEGNYKGAHLETRRSILDMLKLKGELTSADMAGPLNISTMAVRQHLHELKEVGDVACSDLPSGVGRPKKIWSLTPFASRHFSDRHKDLAVDIIHSVREALGEDAIGKALNVRKEQQYLSYEKELEGVDSLSDRLSRLAEIRSREGYLAELADLGSGVFLLSENHCPICQAASACELLCSNELDVFQRCLGEGIKIERTEHIVSGARRCAYRIEKA